MATPQHTDFIQRFCRLHHVVIEENKMQSLTETDVKGFIFDLASGKYGGKTAETTDTKQTAWQIHQLTLFATRLWGAPFPDELRALITQHYPDIKAVRDLNKMQSARILIALDRIGEKK